MRNIGNTLDPVGGTVKITGPTARNATIPQVSVVPGQVVYLKGGALRGMKGGNYTATWSVTQGTKRYTAQAHLPPLGRHTAAAWTGSGRPTWNPCA